MSLLSQRQKFHKCHPTTSCETIAISNNRTIEAPPFSALKSIEGHLEVGWNDSRAEAQLGDYCDQVGWSDSHAEARWSDSRALIDSLEIHSLTIPVILYEMMVK